MKRMVFCCMSLCLALSAVAQDPQVFITGFENGDGAAFGGSQVTASLEEDASNLDGVQPFEGNGLLFVEYNNSGNVWGWSDLDFPAIVDATGMRNIHMLVYFLPDTAPNDDSLYELRLRLYADTDGDGGSNEIDVGYKSAPRNPTTGELVPAEEVPGQWVEYTWEIDKITSEEYLSTLSGVGISIMPGDEGKTGVFYVDNIYTSRPANFPTNLEEVLVYSFDNEELPIQPEGWESAGGQMVIGDGFIPPSQGTNYMEIWIGEWWIQEARTTNAKGATDLWAKATDIIMDIYVGEEFTGTWLLVNPVLQSGGNDADGNPLEKVSGWDSYGEREIFWSGHYGQWKSISWPIRVENHIDALTNEGGWFQIILVTNKDAAEAGKSIYVDNFRLAVAAEGSGVEHWSLF